MSQPANQSGPALAAKAFADGSAPGPAKARPKQQPSNRPRVAANQPQFMLGAQNAPTSLANLAQLSGLNLLPLAPDNSLSALSSTMASIPSASGARLLGAPQAFEPVAVPAATPKARQPRTQKPRLQKQKSTYKSAASLPPTSLDALTGDSDSNYDWLNTGLSHLAPVSRHPSQQQKTNTTRNINKRNNNHGATTNKLPPTLFTSHLYPSASSCSAPANQPLQLNDLHVIPVSEGLSLSVNAVPHLNHHKASSQPLLQPPPPPPPTANLNSINNDIMMSDRPNNFKPLLNEPYVDIDGDSNNISLVKLMAILNNPALTITPVVNPPPYNDQANRHNSTNHSSTFTSSYSSQTTLSIIDDHNPPGNSYYDDSYGSELYKRPTSNGRNRLPQSSANLQLVDTPNKLSNNKNMPSSSMTMGISHSSQLVDLIEDQQKSAKWMLNSSMKSQTSYDQLSPDISRGLLAKTFHQFAASSLDNNEDSYSRDHLEDPLMVSDQSKTSNVQEPKDDFNQSSVSVQLLKHIADQTKDNNEWKPIPEREQELMVESECILSIPPNIQNLSWTAKSVEKIVTVSSDFRPTKTPKQKPKPSATRLYTPTKRASVEKKQAVSADELKISPVKIETAGEKEVFVSEYHDMLERLMSNTPARKFTGAMPEPDEIFINRSKRVMSRIDVMLERKKKRRFERIMSKSEPKTSSLEVQCAESDDEWSEDEDDTAYSTVIKTQLPLCEHETIQKKNHLLGVGLVSRNARNNILVDQCCNRLQIFSPLTTSEIPEVSDNVKRLVDTLIKTDGVDVEMRVDSDIKRNDVPILEGLNRNTSRLKLNYMNTLGLEKRSKRTTLYKIKQYVNATQKMSPNKIKSSLQSKSKVESVKRTQTSVDMAHMNNGFSSEKLLYATCGEALQAPNKNEYMKSLGLMVS